jgi:ankyrin repeat protein
LGRPEVDPNSKDDDRETPLFKAAGNGHKAIVELLLNRSEVDVNLQNVRGDTALSGALGNRDEKKVNILLR